MATFVNFDNPVLTLASIPIASWFVPHSKTGVVGRMINPSSGSDICYAEYGPHADGNEAFLSGAECGTIIDPPVITRTVVLRF